MTTWTILANGPDIGSLTDAGMTRPIVAINHAVAHPTIRADYW